MVKETLDAASTAALTVMNRQFIIARIATEHLIHRLSEVTGETREDLLQELSLSIDATFAAAEEAAEREDDGDDPATEE